MKGAKTMLKSEIKLSDRLDAGVKHNALYDAKVIKACYEKLVRYL